MNQKVITLTDYILKEESKIPRATGRFTLLMTYIANAAKIIASHVKKSGLVDIIGKTGSRNIYDEEVQKLDEYSNNLLIEMLTNSEQVSLIASEENSKPVTLNKSRAKYTVFIDPLDGSSNIDVNVNIGTIFSIYKKSDNFLQKGAKQIAAGYILYGSSVVFVYSFGQGVHIFTLDPSIGNFLLSSPNIRIPNHGNIYSINEAYYDRYPKYLQNYLHSIKASGKFKARYIGSMVADVHRTLLKGGIFIYPENDKNLKGKLRLMFEVNPMSFLIEQAGGLATTQNQNPLQIKPSNLHQRIPIALGSKKNILEFVNYLKNSEY